MTLSARNRLVGKVTEIEFGGVVAHVVVQVGENVITKRSAEEMKLKEGYVTKHGTNSGSVQIMCKRFHTSFWAMVL